MTSRQWTCMCRCCTITIGAFFIASGIYLYANWIEMFTQLRGTEMALSPTSPSYPSWKVSPLPLNFDVYLFNWTNPEDLYVGSKVKPRFEQVGPYRFKEKPDKVDIEWHNDNSSISFRKHAIFYFDAAGSKGKLDDIITTVNTVAFGAAMQAKNANIFQKKILQNTLRVYNERLYVTKTANELMFKGYRDPLVTMGGILSAFSNDIKVPFDRIGFLYTRNNSKVYDGHFNMHTGADDIYKMGQINTWNQKTHTGKYSGVCGDIKGSMGEFFPPNLKTNDTVYIFLPNLCRAIPLDYTETVKVHGITAYKFSGIERSVDNGTLYPEESCFCVNDKCELSGVFNASPCNHNAPIYMSYPHFYKADPSYLEAIDGLSPDKEKHEFFMTLEPNAGVVMDVGGGFQANYLLEPIEDISPFDNIPRTFVPMTWCEERVTVTPEIAEEIALVPLIVLLGQIVTGVLLAGGIILMCWHPTKLITHICHDPKGKNILLRPLSVPRTVIVSTVSSPLVKASPQKPPTAEGLPLLEQKRESFLYPGGVVTEELLVDSTLNSRLQDDVIAR